MKKPRTETENMLISALVEICRTAPPVSAEAEEANDADEHGARCVWLMKCRDLQRIARKPLRQLGIKE